MQLKKELEEKLDNIVKELTDETVDLQVAVPDDLEKGDFTSNIALTLFSIIKNQESGFKSPMELAEKIVDLLNSKYQTQNSFRLIEVKNPGFINFWLSSEEIARCTHKAISGYENKSEESSLIFEFGDPNPFKEPHIGHLRNLVLGEALSRLQEFEGVRVIRANYQGDVGMHVAKCLWGILQKPEIRDQILNDEGTLEEKAKILGEAYRIGAKAFEADPPSHKATEGHSESAKEEIVSINNKIYTSVNSKGKSASSENGEKLYEVWEKGRKVSLDYFEELYKKLGIKYEKYYFESEVALKGRELVEDNLDVFETDERAFVFRAEQFGLHTRVFVNSLGHPTYEAKDLALAFAKNEDYPNIDKSIIMTANEQIDYFRVLLKALEKIDVNLATKTSHLSFGFVNLKATGPEGPQAQREIKMSSRSGNVVNANWLIEEIKNRLKDGFKEVEEGVLDDLSAGAVKWSMLKFSRESDIAFYIDESIDLAGNSGPYMQYTYARIASLLKKSRTTNFEAKSVKNQDQKLVALMRQVCQFEMGVKDAKERYSPNILTNYLFSLAQNFNSYYEKEKIIGTSQEEEILTVLVAVKNTLGKGLNLLGINTPDKI